MSESTDPVEGLNQKAAERIDAARGLSAKQDVSLAMDRVNKFVSDVGVPASENTVQDFLDWMSQGDTGSDESDIDEVRAAVDAFLESNPASDPSAAALEDFRRYADDVGAEPGEGQKADAKNAASEGEETDAMTDDKSDPIRDAFRTRLSEKLGETDKAWVPYSGPQGGEGWKNTDSGEVVYGKEPPGETVDPDEITDEDLEAFAEAEDIDANADEIREALREELGERDADESDASPESEGPGMGDNDEPVDPTTISEGDTITLEDGTEAEVVGTQMDGTPMIEGPMGESTAVNPDNISEIGGPGSDSRVGEDHLATNPMTGREMNANITGDPVVPRGSESDEEMYPVDFENGDSGYVPVSEIEDTGPEWPAGHGSDEYMNDAQHDAWRADGEPDDLEPYMDDAAYERYINDLESDGDADSDVDGEKYADPESVADGIKDDTDVGGPNETRDGTKLNPDRFDRDDANVGYRELGIDEGRDALADDVDEILNTGQPVTIEAVSEGSNPGQRALETLTINPDELEGDVEWFDGGLMKGLTASNEPGYISIPGSGVTTAATYPGEPDIVENGAGDDTPSSIEVAESLADQDSASVEAFGDSIGVELTGDVTEVASEVTPEGAALAAEGELYDATAEMGYVPNATLTTMEISEYDDETVEDLAASMGVDSTDPSEIASNMNEEQRRVMAQTGPEGVADPAGSDPGAEAGGDSDVDPETGLKKPEGYPEPGNQMWGNDFGADELQESLDGAYGYAEYENVIGGIIGSDAMDQYDQDLMERVQQQGIDVNSPMDLFNASGFEEDIINDAAEEVAQEYADAYLPDDLDEGTDENMDDPIEKSKQFIESRRSYPDEPPASDDDLRSAFREKLDADEE